PKPLLWPVSRSVMSLADSTVPCSANLDDSPCSVAEYGKLPTYNFLPIGPPDGVRPLSGDGHHARRLIHGKGNAQDDIASAGRLLGLVCKKARPCTPLRGS